MDFELGRIIAERSFRVVDNDGQGATIHVQLGSPGIVPKSTDVYAPYKIQFGDRQRLFYAMGIDGFQALHLAMQMILVEIEKLERRHQLQVITGRDGKGNLGFNNF